MNVQAISKPQSPAQPSANLPSYCLLNPKYGSMTALLNHFGGKDFKLDLGCGYYKPQGFIGLDNGEGFGTQIANLENAPDVLMDLDAHPLPFPDGSCSAVRGSHFMEHSSNLSHILSEGHRVLKADGRLIIIVPYANSADGMYPGHSIFLTEQWFNENLHFNDKFSIVFEKYYPSKSWLKLPWAVRMLIPFGFARRFLFNACWQMELHCVPKAGTNGQSSGSKGD